MIASEASGEAIRTTGLPVGIYMREEKLWQYLPERRARRRNRFGYKLHQRSRFAPEIHIPKRPEAMVRREEFGHWECDLVQFRQRFGKSNITSTVERVSRFTVFLKNNDRRSKPIMDQLIHALNPLPFVARRSISFDRGTEFTDWLYLQAGLGVQTWFCDPHSPWQKGTVENTNRRARRQLLRDRDPMTLKNQTLRLICERLNATPRKYLGYKTPAEVFEEKLLEEWR